MLRLPGIAELLPAIMIQRQKTSAENAWRTGSFHTIRLVEALPAIRVHSRVGSAAAKDPKFAVGAGTLGRWFAIGDVILTRDEYADLHALPGRFTTQDEYLLPPGTELNVGIAARLFGYSGGALQAERLAGPNPKPQPVKGFWANRYGNA
jgi:hypothetical protein